MTVTLYDAPVDDNGNPRISTRFTATVNGVAAAVSATARTTEFGVTGVWALGETVEQAWLTIATDEDVTVVVTFLDGPVTSARCHPEWINTDFTISGSTVTVTLPAGTGKAWIEVNGERAEPIHIRSVLPFDEPAAPPGYTLTTFNGTQTECAADELLVFPAGNWDIGKQFKVYGGGIVYIHGAAWVNGSFDVVEQDDVYIYGHGVLSGEQWTPSTVIALPYFEKLAYSLIYGYSATYMHSNNEIEGIVITRTPFAAQFEGICSATDVMIINPWWSNSTGLALEGNLANNNQTTTTNCYIWCCDDGIDTSEYVGGHTVTGTLLASSASAAFMLGYWPGTDYGLDTTIEDCTVVAIQSHNEDPESGIIFHAWSDGYDNIDQQVIADVNVTNVHVEGSVCYAQLFNLSNTHYPWGAEDARDRNGSITRWTFKNIFVEAEPETLSVIEGYDENNTPYDISFDNLRIGCDPMDDTSGELVTVRNYLDYFDPFGLYPYNIRFGGRAVTTQVDICNMALAHIGNKAKVTSISPVDGSAEATHCERFFPMAVNALLDMHNWSWATAKVELTAINLDDDDEQTDNDDEAWQWRYEIPNGMVRAISVLPDDSTNDYLVAGQRIPVDFCIKRSNEDEELRIYTNQEAAFLRYILYEDDPNVWDPLFIMALSWHLASLLAGPIIKGQEGHAEAQRCLQRMGQYLAEAKQKDASERQVTLTRKASYIAGR